MRMYLILYSMLPLIIASDVVNSVQNVRDISRPQRRNQRIVRVPSTTTTTTTTMTSRNMEQTGTADRSIGSDFVPREVFKFELADAKIPDFHPQFQHERHQTQPTNGHRQRIRQRKSKKQQHQTSITENNDANLVRNQEIKKQQTGDQSGADSRLLHITHPSSETIELQRQRGMKPLPSSVANAISQALKKDFNHPYLDTIKYYFNEPVPKTTKLTSPFAGAKLVNDSQIKQWWQRPPFVKTSSSSSSFSSSTNLLKISSTTMKPGHFSDTTSSSLLTNEYVAYPLLRSYPLQYSLNVASDLVNGVGFLYGDRIYANKPYTYQKNINQVNSLRSEIKPVVESKPVENDDNIITGIYHTTENSLTSTSPILFPKSTSESPKSHSFIKYYAAKIHDDDGGIPLLSTDKNTLNLINKAISEWQKHNPHLDIVAKRIENDELIVHVTPKPDYFTTSTTSSPMTTITNDKFNTNFNVDKNLLYLNKFNEPVKSTEKPNNDKKTQHSTYLAHVGEAPADSDGLLEQGYAFGYRVRDHSTGTDFGHTQKRMTDGTTMGEYKILMPDGRMQNVKYKADDNGYQADVSYDV